MVSCLPETPIQQIVVTMTASSHDPPPTSPAGRVALVGGGPGAPDLLTLRGAWLLSQADVVLYDYLANPDLLTHARADAELICLGKHGQTRVWSQSEINEKMVELARLGRRVVRLKGGDPAVFGRGAEELEWLTRHGIPFEVVPGVTAASAVAAFTGVPLTHRQFASAVALVTGHGSRDQEGEPVDFHALSRFPGTIVVYMGVTSAPQWVEQLIAGGMSPTTPAVLVRRCSLPDQKVVRCELGDIPTVIRASHLRPPVLACIGEAVRAGETWSWFENRPLFGRRILVTRPAHQADDLARPLGELGAHVLRQPAIHLAPLLDNGPLDAQLKRLEHWDWIVFSSANGVRFFLQRLRELGRDWRALGKTRFAVIGPATRAALEEFGFIADAQPESFVAEELAAMLEPQVAGQRVLLVRASRGREVLADRLRPVAAQLEQVVTYLSEDVTAPDPDIAAALERGEIDWVTVTSSAIAASLAQMFGASLRRARLASISPITTSTLRQLGYEPAVEAQEQTMTGVVQAILSGQLISA